MKGDCMGNVVGMPGANKPEEEKIQAVFGDAMITKFSFKVNNLGIGVGQLVLEIESDNPDEDFAPLLKLAQYHVSLGIQSGKVRIADL